MGKTSKPEDKKESAEELDYKDKIISFLKVYDGRVTKMGAQVAFPVPGDTYSRPSWYEEIRIEPGDDLRVARKVLTEKVIARGKEHVKDVASKPLR